MEYRWDSINRLIASLDATNVVSEDYKNRIIAMALDIASEAYKAGVSEEKDRETAKKLNFR